MRILVLENEPSSMRGGQELSLLDVCRGLATRGHAIDLLYLKEGDLLGEYETFARRVTRIQCYAIDRNRSFVSTASWLGSLVSVFHRRVDAVYANQYHDTLFGGVLASLWRRPLVCHLRLLPPEPICGQFRIGLSLVSRFIANSQEVRRRYVAAGYLPDLIDVVYNGIDLDRFSPASNGQPLRASLGAPAGWFVVLYAGRLDPGKGLEVLLHAFARLPQHARLWLAGGPLVHESETSARAYMCSLRHLAEDLRVAHRVAWLGRRSDVPDLCRASDVVVLPSAIPESFGRVLVEGMACGVPAIGPRHGGTPEVLSGEFQRYLFTPGDGADLARVLLSIADWRASDPELARRCRRHAEERFSMGRSVEGVEESLLRASGERGREGVSG